MKYILTTLLISVVAFAAIGQGKVTLTVNIEGVKSTEGELLLAVFNSESSYLKTPLIAQSIDLSEDERRSFKVEGLEPGEYTLSIIHDANSNGDIDIGMMGPTEDYGFSNNARGMFGPADYQDALMKIDSDKIVTIQIK